MKIACERILAWQTGGRCLCTARYESKSCVLKGFLAEFGGVLYADHVRFHSCHPYIERLPTL